MDTMTFDDEPPPEPREGWLLVRVFVPELNVHKSLQFPSDKIVWDVKQQCLASLPKELKESFNYGLFSPPSNGKAGKFLDEERRLGDYPFNGPVGYLELKYKRRVYKMLNLDERQLKALHTRANLRRFIECINSGQVEKIAKMCAKGLDPNFHCQETGETPLTIATGSKKPNKLLIALVNGGALLDYRTRDGATALHRAVERDSLEAVSTLLELGASPNYRDTKGLTPVYLSVTRKTDPKISEVLLHDHATLGIQDSQGWQEVHQACRNGLVHHLEHLLFYGADMDGQNASGNTPLHVCAVNNQEACARMLLFRGANRGALNYANQTPYQVAVIAGNLELAEMIQNYKNEDIVPFRGPPRYNPRRRSGLGWGSTLSRIYGGPPSPCPSEHPFSSASSSLSEGSSHRSHEDDISIVTDKSLGDTSDIISDSSGVGTNSDSAACSIGHPSTTVVCMEGYDTGLSGHIHIQPGDVIEVVGSTDCGLLEGFVRGTNKTGFFPASCVQEVQFRQKSIINVSTSTPHHHYLINTSSNEIVSHDLQQQLQQQQQQQQQHHQLQQQQHQHLQQQQPSSLDQQQHPQQQYSSQTAPRVKKSIIGEPRTVVLHRAKRGFGFILRGAKASSPLMQLKPSPRCPALQYLDDVDPGGVADMAGLKPGDFLLAINSEDVTCASHEHVVDLIRNSGSLVSMTVVTLSQNLINSMMLESSEIGSQHSSGSGMSTPISSRQCSTLPRRMNGGPPGSNCKQPAPMPPRRDPKTTLSVGRARAKSMVAGLEGGGEKGVDDDELLNATKSTSAESIHQVQTQLLQAQQCHSAIGTPTQTGPGTPVQPRTASIKSRPTSSRITAAELEELFQRQQGADANRCSMLMSSSRFQSTGFDSGAGTPPISPQKGPIVYASVAEMKRKKSSKAGMGTLKGRPIPIPQIGSDLKRTFHSTPDLASMSSSNQHGGAASSLLYGSSSSGTGSQLAINANGWYNTVGHKGHRSQDDMHSLHMSLQRLNLPPPNHPPPPPPVGQVVKVDVSRGSEYECLTALRKHIAQKAKVQSQVQESEVMSSFKPASNAKLYASPQDIRNVGYRTVNVTGASPSPSLTGATTTGPAASNGASSCGGSNGSNINPNVELCKTASLRSNSSSTISVNSSSVTGSVNNVTTVTITGSASGNAIASSNSNASSASSNQYAQPGRPGSTDTQQQVAQPQALYKSPPNNAPPLPEPDYSLSESDPDEDNSVRLVRTHLKANGDLKAAQNPGMAAETSGNSNTSGSSTGSSSMPHSFSVEEIQKIRTKLKSSKSYPNDFLRQQNSQQPHPGVDHGASGGPHEEGDNSSSGVSSDQEVTITCNDTMKQPKQPPAFPKQQVVGATALKANAITSAIGTGASGLNEPKKVTLQLGGSAVVNPKLKPSNSLPERRSDAEDNEDGEQDGTDSPSPPATGFQRHNSLTRKQAATIAANRAKANQQNLQQRHAVTLATLPPPIEAADSDEADSWPHTLQSAGGDSAVGQLVEGGGMVVLAPPPEFSDSTVSHSAPISANNGGVSISVQGHHSHQHTHQHHQHQHVHHHHQHAGSSGSLVLGGHNPNCKRVRIVGAVPKVNRMNSQ